VPRSNRFLDLVQVLFPTFQSFLFLTSGSLIAALSFVLFFAPSNIAPGGTTGIVLIITRYLNVPAGLTFLTLNIPLVTLGFFQLGRFKFLAKTAYVVLLNNLMIDVFSLWLPTQGLSEDILLNTLYGAVGSGIGYGLLLRAGGNIGGTGILSRVFQLRSGLPMSQVYIFTDGSIILALGLVFGWENALYSMLALFLNGLSLDYVLEGPNVLRMIFIVTEHPQTISEALRERLLVGVTQWEGAGTHSNRSKTILLCTVPRSDSELVKSIVLEFDQQAFVVVGQAGSRAGGLIKAKEFSKLKKQQAQTKLER